MSVDLHKLRNIGIAAHIDAGKTTTTERVLYYAGRTHRMGEVDDGTTVTDFDEEEQKRGITIYSAAVTLSWREHTINLIDTPGHVDFTAEVERAMRVLDGMVAVFDAKEGVEAQSETVWRQADKYHVPRLCFINKMDRLGADFERAVDSIRARLHPRPILLQSPIGAADSFQGLLDLVNGKAVYYQPEAQGVTFTICDVPEEWQESVQHARQELIETLAETNEEMMEAYVAGRAVDAELLRRAIRAATLRHEVVPVLCGSALRYIGVQRLLDAVCDFLPGPLEVPPIVARDGKHADQTRSLACDAAGPLAALVFKVVAEKPMDLFYLRLYSGTLRPNSRLLNPVTGSKENVSRVYRMFAKRREQLLEAEAGDIVAVVGPKNVLTGHTLCDARTPVVLESIEFPQTVISVSVEPRSSRDRDKLLESLQALVRQDPTLSVTSNPETGQTLLSGMGELHLEVIIERLRRDMNVDAVVGKPRVSYRETVRQTGEGTGRFARNIGGRDHFASVRLRIAPRAPVQLAAHFEIVSALATGELPALYLAAAETGIREAALSGILGGYPVIDWTATILSVEKHERDSSELAFENAARQAFYEAMRAARPVLLQPIMDVEVVTAEEHVGSVMTDLNSRQAVVQDTLRRGSSQVILAKVPLSQMFGYVTRLRSISQGRATSAMAPSHYAAVAEEEMKALVG